MVRRWECQYSARVNPLSLANPRNLKKGCFLFKDLRSNYSSFYDAGGSIGRRYRRQDEAGTPFGVTVDHDTLNDNTVTLRDRDTMEQIRVGMDKVSVAIEDKIKALYNLPS